MSVVDYDRPASESCDLIARCRTRCHRIWPCATLQMHARLYIHANEILRVNDGAFHFIFDFAEREPFAFIYLLTFVPIVFLLLAVATLKQFHPVLVWVAISLAVFGLSQVFPENRSQWLGCAVGIALLSAFLVWWWFSRIAPQIRASIRRKREAR